MSDTRTETYRKTCECKRATASGPRIVTADAVRADGGRYVFLLNFVIRACDVCDKPWQLVESVEVRPD